MDENSFLFLGLLAGTLNMSSSIPQLVANIRNPELAKSQSPSRQALQMLGNLAWLGWGIGNSADEVMLFASLGSAMASILWFQTIRARMSGAEVGERSISSKSQTTRQKHRVGKQA